MNLHEDLNFVKIIQFIEKVGISVKFRQIEEETFLPGLRIENGVLIIDKQNLKYVGDTLHEAGHIAILNSKERNSLSGNLENQQYEEANEMAVLAWTYAACLEIDIEPTVVFHAHGYKGEAENIINNFNNGQYIGVPMLQWYGMAKEKANEDNVSIFPKMISWMRQ